MPRATDAERLDLLAPGGLPGGSEPLADGSGQQQAGTREVLMVAWMDDEALHRTLTSGRATYWSRSRGSYWVKGDTSGHVQHVTEVRLDCDGDALLVVVDQAGAACHTGDRTCFDADLLLGGATNERDRTGQ